MASTFPEKSRPLHNFCLPQLKWNEGPVHQRRRSVESPSRRPIASSASPVRQSPHAVSPDNLGKSPLDESLNSKSAIRGDRNGYLNGMTLNLESTRNRDASIDCRRKNHVSSNPIGKTEKVPSQRIVPLQREAETKKSNTQIKVSTNVVLAKIDEDEALKEGKLVPNDEEAKIWNLRPRKPNAPPPVIKSHKSGVSATEKKQKRKLSLAVALSKEEIEEDIFAMTGSKPARRPKKRSRNIQKDLNSVFPGLWLVSITADSYKVSELSLKQG